MTTPDDRRTVPMAIEDLAPHATMLVGHDVTGFRTDVQETLTELQCCTHLNDMVRGLTEVPRFAAVLMG